MKRPILYVCAPYQTRTHEEALETDKAIGHALQLGWAPVFAPYLLNRFICEEEPSEREMALDCCMSLLEGSDAVLVVGDRRTNGMWKELARWERIRFNRREPSVLYWPCLRAPSGAA